MWAADEFRARPASLPKTCRWVNWRNDFGVPAPSLSGSWQSRMRTAAASCRPAGIRCCFCAGVTCSDCKSSFYLLLKTSGLLFGLRCPQPPSSRKKKVFLYFGSKYSAHMKPRLFIFHDCTFPVRPRTSNRFTVDLGFCEHFFLEQSAQSDK